MSEMTVQKPAEHDGLAIASLVTAFFVPVAAIVLGHMSNHRARKAGKAKSGLAVAGLVLGYIFTVGGILLAIMLGVTAASVQNDINSYQPSPAATLQVNQMPGITAGIPAGVAK